MSATTFTLKDGRTFTKETEVGNNEFARVLLVEAKQNVQEQSLDDTGDDE